MEELWDEEELWDGRIMGWRIYCGMEELCNEELVVGIVGRRLAVENCGMEDCEMKYYGMEESWDGELSGWKIVVEELWDFGIAMDELWDEELCDGRIVG